MEWSGANETNKTSKWIQICHNKIHKIVERRYSLLQQRYALIPLTFLVPRLHLAATRVPLIKILISSFAYCNNQINIYLGSQPSLPETYAAIMLENISKCCSQLLPKMFAKCLQNVETPDKEEENIKETRSSDFQQIPKIIANKFESLLVNC